MYPQCKSYFCSVAYYGRISESPSKTTTHSSSGSVVITASNANRAAATAERELLGKKLQMIKCRRESEMKEKERIKLVRIDPS